MLAFVATAALTLAAPNAAGSQVVAPRTVPVQQSGQFAFFPTALAGMAGASFVLDDTLLDPFVNGARATTVRGLHVFTELTSFNSTRGGAGGYTFPLGAVATHGRWAYGGIGALQRVDAAALPNASAAADLRATNRYASVLVARRLARGLSIGANAYYAGLEALQGLGALYAGSDSIALDGRMSDVRLGMVKHWSAGRSLDVIVLHNRTDIAHDVRLFDVMWDPSVRTTVRVPRLEHNEDRGRTWGAHSRLVTRLAGPDSTRVGLLLTANRLTHPKIPNYRFSNLPRDPGTTYAFNIGAGIGQSTRRASFGFDVMYEPMFSHTWAEAGPGATTADATPIPADTRTIENHFRFSNVKVAFGLGREFLGADTMTAVGFQFGLVVDRTTYRLRQEDNLTQSARRQRVGFTEWGPTLGIHWRGPRLRIGYSLALTCSPGACAIGQGDDVTVAGPEPGVIASPTANLGFDFGRSLVQKFTFSVPIGR